MRACWLDIGGTEMILRYLDGTGLLPDSQIHNSNIASHKQTLLTQCPMLSTEFDIRPTLGRDD